MASGMRIDGWAAVVMAASMLAAGAAVGAKGPTEESREAAESAQQMAEARAAPGIVLPGAYTAAWTSLAGLPVVGAGWTEVTTRPYNAGVFTIGTRVGGMELESTTITRCCVAISD